MLKKNKLSFPSYWLPVMLIGFVPHSGYGDTVFTKRFVPKNAAPQPQAQAAAPQVSTPAAAAPATSGPAPASVVPAPVPAAPVAPAAAQPAAAPAAPASADSSTEPPATSAQQAPVEKAGILSLADAQTAFGGNLEIVEQQKGDVSYAYLEGVVPNACLGDIQVRTTTKFPEISSNSADGSNSIEGFAIHDNGQLISCMSQHDCSDENTQCTSLSKLQAPIVLDHSKHVHLSYFAYNRLKGNLDQGAWTAFDIAGSPADTLSKAEIDANAKATKARTEAARETLMKNEISTCLKSADGIEEAKILAASLDPDDQTTALGMIAKQEAKVKSQVIVDQEKAIAAVEKKIDATSVKVSDLDDLEDQIYSINDKLTDMNDKGDLKDADYNKLENRLVADVQKMVDVRLTDDDANQDSIDRAHKMLDRVINGDDDDDTSTDSLHPTKEVLASIQKQMDYDLPRATVSEDYMKCADDQLGLGANQQSAQSNPFAMMSSNSGAMSAMKDCQAYSKEMTSTMNDLDKQYKKDKCVDKNGLPNSKRSSDKELDATCSEIEAAAQALQEVPSDDGKILQAQQQQIQKQRQTLMAQQQRPGTQTAQMGMMQMPGAPTAPMFTNPMMAGGGIATGYQNALGPNPAIYSGSSYMPGLTVPMSSMTMPGSTAFNPYMGAMPMTSAIPMTSLGYTGGVF